MKSNSNLKQSKMKKLLFFGAISIGLMSFNNANIVNPPKTANANKNNTSIEVDGISLSAAGSTFAGPIYKAAFSKYLSKTGVTVSYGLTGSGAGIRSLKDKVVDFCGSDAFLSDAEMKEMSPVVHIPTCSGAVDVAFNIPGVKSIKLTPALLTKIFMGQVTNWNNPELKKINAGVKFPDLAITVVYRSDGSGTTAIFSDYMSKISKEWSDKIGAGKSLKWPVGMGAKGNPGVAGIIGSTSGSIGYIGSEYAEIRDISFASIQNKAGNFIAPTIEAVSAAGKSEIPADTRVMETNSSAPKAYPISGFTWIILYKNQDYNGRTFEQAQATLKLIDWMLNPEVQAMAKQLNYAPLPAKVVKMAKGILRTVTYKGKVLLK
ncbi:MULTISPECIES: phosphate ABC transporter substrate-binding protein PstS [unclassified Flavobacterium]|jgi:phosphate transport system substrate-binding protein|uniref:phosphate ABC transporter substrate-binding protein PstS n=2 Tax=Flavobacterium TaxID=237 RepID=UPI0025C04B92|nr:MULTISPECIES: phosphate ABC transporter substrate-binding protein PstS [unclassified Flavobacterium]